MKRITILFACLLSCAAAPAQAEAKWTCGAWQDDPTGKCLEVRTCTRSVCDKNRIDDCRTETKTECVKEEDAPSKPAGKRGPLLLDPRQQPHRTGPRSPGAPQRTLFDDRASPAFNCDVETNVCTCKGSLDGVDCKRMEEECWDERSPNLPKRPKCNATGCACCLDGKACTVPEEYDPKSYGPRGGRRLGTEGLAPGAAPSTNPAATPSNNVLQPQRIQPSVKQQPSAGEDAAPEHRRFQIQRNPKVD